MENNIKQVGSNMSESSAIRAAENWRDRFGVIRAWVEYVPKNNTYSVMVETEKKEK